MSNKTASGRGGIVQFAIILGLTFTVAACSSASNRFGPFDEQKTATVDPGYQPAKPIYTSSVQRPQKADTFNRSVQRGSLNDVPRETQYLRPNKTGQQYVAPQRHTTGQRTVTVRHGDTLYSISRAHKVPVKDLIAENRLDQPYHVRTGQVLVVPAAYVASTRSTFQQKTIRTASSYQVKPGETLYRISANHGMKTNQLADYNHITSPYTVKPGQILRIPGTKTAASTQKTNKTTKTAGVLKITKQPRAAVKTAALKTSGKSNARKKREQYKGPLPQPVAMTSAKFRWPVKGRIISQFGTKQNGQKNDGINITVPAGTSVKASENGVVAYAGNELRGYGNLVLVRHAGGWVTAYAHNSKMLVQRGDQVRRGQIIAKAGQTGSVTSPQLHFEVRKGSKAIDPIRHLSSTHVASK